MSMTWLANADKSTFWPHHTWKAYETLANKDRIVAILPIHGLADHGLGMPLDVEEIVGEALLRSSVAASAEKISYRVLPPLRFGLSPYPSTFFGVDAETAHDMIHEIAANVLAAGIKKLVFFVTSPWHEEFVDAASRDTRISLNLQTFVINLSGLDLSFHPTRTSRGQLQLLGSYLTGKLPEASTRPADIEDAGFRPGNFRQPAALAPDFTLNQAIETGGALFKSAAMHLARLLAEVDARGPLGSKVHRDPVTIDEPEACDIGTIWPDSYRPRYLGGMTRDQLEALPDKDKAFVILPTGAIEQHGHHLPVGVDSIMGQAWLNYSLPHLPADAPVYVAPPITFGKSNEHVGFPGTIYISAKTLRRLVLAIAAQLKALGFKQIGFLNTHGGNSAVLDYTAREIHATLGMRCGMLRNGYRPDVPPQEAEYGFHAGEWETSTMLEVTEGLIDMANATCEFPAKLEDPGELRPENAPAIYSWITKDVSVSGVMGDATAASKAKGDRWMNEAAVQLAQRLVELTKG